MKVAIGVPEMVSTSVWNAQNHRSYFYSLTKLVQLGVLWDSIKDPAVVLNVMQIALAVRMRILVCLVMKSQLKKIY